MKDLIVEKNNEARNNKGKIVSGKRVETRRQKVSEDKQTTLEVEIHRNPAQGEDPTGRGTEGNGTFD